jgi:hypothetical protein
MVLNGEATKFERATVRGWYGLDTTPEILELNVRLCVVIEHHVVLGRERRRKASSEKKPVCCSGGKQVGAKERRKVFPRTVRAAWGMSVMMNTHTELINVIPGNRVDISAVERGSLASQIYPARVVGSLEVKGKGWCNVRSSRIHQINSRVMSPAVSIDIASIQNAPKVKQGSGCDSIASTEQGMSSGECRMLRGLENSHMEDGFATRGDQRRQAAGIKTAENCFDAGARVVALLGGSVSVTGRWQKPVSPREGNERVERTRRLYGRAHNGLPAWNMRSGSNPCPDLPSVANLNRR